MCVTPNSVSGRVVKTDSSAPAATLAPAPGCSVKTTSAPWTDGWLDVGGWELGWWLGVGTRAKAVHTNGGRHARARARLQREDDVRALGGRVVGCWGLGVGVVVGGWDKGDGGWELEEG